MVPRNAWQGGGGSNNVLILGGILGCGAGGYYAYSSGMLDGDALPAGAAKPIPVPRPRVRPAQLLLPIRSRTRRVATRVVGGVALYILFLVSRPRGEALDTSICATGSAEYVQSAEYVHALSSRAAALCAPAGG